MNYVAFVEVAVGAEGWLKAHNIGLDSEIVLTAAEEEVAVHAPSFVVGVADDPVLRLTLIVKAPSNEHDRVILVLPREASILHSLCARQLLRFELLLAHVAVGGAVILGSFFLGG